MTAKDQVKMLDAGFTIIRRDLGTLAIKAKTPQNQNWHTFKGKDEFSSGAERDRFINALLTSSKIVEE